jgi:hypothetical protein
MLQRAAAHATAETWFSMAATLAQWPDGHSIHGESILFISCLMRTLSLPDCLKRYVLNRRGSVIDIIKPRRRILNFDL